MYDEDYTHEIPDSDAKIFMSLDDIIKMEGVRKRGPGSVRSMASRRSTYTNKSRRSTYSNRSMRSTYSNKSRRSNYSNKSRRSNYSNKSRRSNYSNKSGRSNKSLSYVQITTTSYPGKYFQQRRLGNQLIRRNMFGVRPESDAQYKVLKGPGFYTPNNHIRLYRNKVKQAVRMLSTPWNKNQRGFRKVLFDGQTQSNTFNFRHVKNKNITKKPLLRKVPLQNVSPLLRQNAVNSSWTGKKSRNLPLTRQTLAIFNKMNKKKYPYAISNSRLHSNASYISSTRHSIKASLNRQTQSEIANLQRSYAANQRNSDHYDTNFVPTSHTTTLSISERFSMYD